MLMLHDLDVVVVGNVGIDTNVYLAGDAIDWQTEANFTDNLDYVGQAGGYSSRGFARLGKRTAFVGYTGDDELGTWIRRELAGDGIDLQAMFVDPAGTSRSVNLVYRNGQRKNFYDGKSHMQLQPDLAVCEAVLARARVAMFHLPNWARLLLPIARRHGLTVVCDLQDLGSADDPYRRDFVEHADIVFFSAANLADPAAVAASLASGGRLAVAGLGADGCLVATSEGTTRYPPIALDLPIVDTNGAGDALAVGFTTAYVLDGYGVADAALRGQIAARWTCAIKAASDELIDSAELDRSYERLRDTGRVCSEHSS